MNKYRVTMKETVTYEFEIESESDETVPDDAEEFFVNVEDLGPITKGVDDREVWDWEKINE
jgi:hypothetical protein